MGVFIKNLSAEALTYQEYLAYLETIKEEIPAVAYSYGKAPWHYNLSDPRSIHDAWLKSLTISDTIQDRPETCIIQLIFLGAFHDRLFKFIYKNVISYSFEASRVAGGHSDVYLDEIRLSDARKCVHEMLFMSNTRWIIECNDFFFEEEMLPKT